eukprot:15470830-Alexandrium_andersonii.AAC.1
MQRLREACGKRQRVELAQAMGDFFHRLKRSPGQTIQKFNDLFNRQNDQLKRLGVALPDGALCHFYLRGVG